VFDLVVAWTTWSFRQPIDCQAKNLCFPACSTVRKHSLD